MPVLDPETPIVEEAPAPPAPRPATVALAPAVRPICAVCRRPLWALNGEPVQNGDGSYKHDDARLDIGGNEGAHPAELFVEPPVRWGFLDVKGKSNFEVSSGPSKVRSGWSGGGVA